MNPHPGPPLTDTGPRTDTGRPRLLGVYRPLQQPVELWSTRCAAPHTETYAADEATLTSAERARLTRIRTDSARAQYVAGRALARRVLARHVTGGGKGGEGIAFGSTDEGRPFLARPPVPGLDFNLAHSGRLAVLAVTKGPGRVGVDVERLAPGRDFTGIARHFFSADEYERWSTAPEGERVADWYRSWTRREAWTKASGAGLRDIGAEHHGRGSTWADIAFTPEPGYAGCLVLLTAHSPATSDVRGDDRP
ncbi:4'-phosphopantetheinyl transferase family protein [Streptomyces daliensis]|uniref:4'-phosphopantetheinyl transferase superfamily protein n=1 Tax=Streptomyces daliensis TaxID=299421 RepID=A0A8T4IZ92_9ACTN|nr:4'-phosphopantetheinyl transferase superfamily protein [Streptomyces daliensis]